MCWNKIIVNLAIKNPRINSLEKYLFVGPHPDDIEIGAGATISRLVKEGKQVSFLICIDGRYGKENVGKDISCEELIEIRKNEAIESAKTLGVTDVNFLNLCDGNQYSYSDLVKGIAQVVNNKQPDIIFGPDPDVISECHMDHLNVGKACKEIACFASFKEILEHYLPNNEIINNVDIQAVAFYMTAKPNKFIATLGHFKKQLEAIKCHKSQFPENSEAFKALKLYLGIRSLTYGDRLFSMRAEGFRVMNKTRMHCIPEAGK